MKISPKRPKLNMSFPSLVDPDLVFLGVPKCATTTIRAAMGQWRTTKTAVSLAEAAGYPHRFTVIRDPVKRLHSAWGHVWYGHRWEDFVAHVLANPDWDVHTARYADKQARVANVLLTQESLAETWLQLVDVFPKLPLLKQSFNVRRRDAPPVIPLAEEIRSVYRDDLSVWQSVVASGGILFR